MDETHFKLFMLTRRFGRVIKTELFIFGFIIYQSLCTVFSIVNSTHQYLIYLKALHDANVSNLPFKLLYS